jgi:hypothetical protein
MERYTGQMKWRHPLAWVLGFVAFAINPALACSSSDAEEFEYGEAEMIAAVRGTWRLTYARPDATTSVLTFTVAQGPAASGALAPPGIAPQCTTRTFTRPAAACSPTSHLMVTAAVLEASPPLDTAQGKGSYTIDSVKYIGGMLALTFGSNLRVNAVIDASNAVGQSYASWQGAAVTTVLDHTSTN